MAKVKIGDEEIKFKAGALRQQLKVPKGKNIPPSLINKINKANAGDSFTNPFTNRQQKITPLLKKRTAFAKSLATLRNKK
jgi:hypothetical protein